MRIDAIDIVLIFPETLTNRYKLILNMQNFVVLVSNFAIFYFSLAKFFANILVLILVDSFLLISSGIIYVYYGMILKIDEDDFGGHGTLLQEGLFASITLFLVLLLFPVISFF